ncbi:MAG: glycerophosphodiester phosphodiesterase family protein [Pseudomonadota bacterium]
MASFGSTLSNRWGKPLNKLALALMVAAITVPTAWSEWRTASKIDPPEPPQKVFVVGHRGAPNLAPEHTRASYDAAIEAGAHMVELDVRYTADGHFVVMHDATVDRTTNGSGRVKDMTLADFRRLDAGSWMGPQFKGQTALSLVDALRYLKGRVAIDLDFKDGPDNAGKYLSDLLDQEDMNRGPLITVFVRLPQYEKIQGLRAPYKLRPHYLTPGQTRRLAQKGTVEVMGMRWIGFSLNNARDIRRSGLFLFANVMGPKDGPVAYHKGLTAGAQFIQTDHVDQLSLYLNEHGRRAQCIPSFDFDCYNPNTDQMFVADAESVVVSDVAPR